MSSRAAAIFVLTVLVAGQTVFSQSHPAAIVSSGIANGYLLPTSKVGIADTVYAGLLGATMDSRYARFSSIGTKLKIYNLWWSSFEASTTASSLDPNLACASGLRRVPANETERIAKGFHRYRCLSESYITLVRAILKKDQDSGIESAAVIFSTPPMYRTPGCTGAVWGQGTLDDACVPSDAAMNDFEDYVNFLASDFNGGANGRLTHFIIWNEFQSGRWFNLSPNVTWNQTGQDLSTPEIDALVDKYSDMLRRAHAAINRHIHPALMYISLDPSVAAGSQPGAPGTVIYTMDTIAAMQGLWTELGTSIDWSIAIHPYGAPTADLGAWHNYAKLHFFVDYQIQQLTARGVANPINRPQSVFFASEQGWELPANLPAPQEYQTRVQRATYICQAHDISMRLPTLVGSTHNSFQSAGPGDLLGLLPASAGSTLAALDPMLPEWLAYQGTGPANWGKNNNHGCCTVAGVGCVGAIVGSVDGVAFEGGEWVLKGWACSRGVADPIDVHLYGAGPAGGGGVLAGAFRADLPSAPAISAACYSSGKNFSYRIPLTPWLAYHGVPLYVHGISPYGAPNDLLPGSGAHHIP